MVNDITTSEGRRQEYLDSVAKRESGGNDSSGDDDDCCWCIPYLVCQAGYYILKGIGLGLYHLTCCAVRCCQDKSPSEQDPESPASERLLGSDEESGSEGSQYQDEGGGAGRGGAPVMTQPYGSGESQHQVYDIMLPSHLGGPPLGAVQYSPEAYQQYLQVGGYQGYYHSNGAMPQQGGYGSGYVTCPQGYVPPQPMPFVGQDGSYYDGWGGGSH